MAITAKSYDDLPLTLKIEQVAQVLGVSRKVAYELAKQKGFPAVRVGEKRLCVPRDRFIEWLNRKADKALD